MRVWGRSEPLRAGLGTALLVGLVSAVLLSLAVALIDVALAFIGGVLIGCALGFWILPGVVDALDREELAERLHRIHHRRGP